VNGRYLWICFLFREPEEQEKLEKRDTYNDQYASNLWEGTVDQEVDHQYKDHHEEHVEEGEGWEVEPIPDTVGEPGNQQPGWGSEEEGAGWGLNEQEGGEDNQWT